MLEPAAGQGPEDAVVRSASGTTLTARRFAAAPSVELGSLLPGGSVEIAAPGDAATQPWIVTATPGPLAVCEPAAPAE